MDEIKKSQKMKQIMREINKKLTPEQRRVLIRSYLEFVYSERIIKAYNEKLKESE